MAEHYIFYTINVLWTMFSFFGFISCSLGIIWLLFIYDGWIADRIYYGLGLLFIACIGFGIFTTMVTYTWPEWNSRDHTIHLERTR